MRRRAFISLIGGVAAVWALCAHAQQQGIPVVGMLSESAEVYSHLAEAARLGLKDESFVDGQNVRIEYRWAAGRDEQLPTMAVELVNRPVAFGRQFPPRPQQQQFPLYSLQQAIQSNLASLQASIGPAAMSRVSVSLGLNLSRSAWNWPRNWCPKRSLSDSWGDHANRDTQQTEKLSRVPLLHSDEKYYFSMLRTSANWNLRSRQRSANILAS